MSLSSEQLASAEKLYDYMVEVGEFDCRFDGDIEEGIVGGYLVGIDDGVRYEDSVGAVECVNGVVREL